MTEVGQVLIQDDPPATEAADTRTYSAIDENTEGGKQPSPQTSRGASGNGNDYTYGRNATYDNHSSADTRIRDTPFRETSNMNDDLTYMPDGPSDGFYDGGSGNNDSQTRFTRPHFDKFAKRTVLLANLPEAVTHADIVDVVRGGMLLDIYLRTHDRAASVSFLKEAHAQEFYRHVKRQDLYIGGKRVIDPRYLYWYK